MKHTELANLETDPRFPSGPWTGFFLQRALPGRHMMELALTFKQGVLTGEGRDWVGKFVLRGKYELSDGKCYWTKRYLGKHDVFYEGYNEGNGIWGVWEIPPVVDASIQRGGFQIWPEGMSLAEDNALAEEADLPLVIEGSLETAGVSKNNPAGRSKDRPPGHAT
jgi:hypothetical protein